MAHNINFNNGKHSFFTVKQKAWHGLGQVVEDCPTSEQAIKLAGLDYSVEKRPIFLQGGVEIPNRFATVRTDNDTPFGIVGNRYEVLQNTEAFEFFDAIVGKGEAIYETAGALGDGEIIFITAKLPDYIRVGKDDLIEQYIFLTNNHTGWGAVQAAFTPVRIVCNNTLNAALKQSTGKISLKHSKNVAQNLREAHKLMGIANKLSEQLSEVFNAMAKKPMVDQKLKDLIVATFATPNAKERLAKSEEVSTKFQTIIGDVYAYAMSSDTQQLDTTRGTVFGAYNAVTGYLQNVRSEGVEDRGAYLKSLLGGTDFQYTQRAFDLCLQEID